MRLSRVRPTADCDGGNVLPESQTWMNGEMLPIV
jgi:hypothetical protein